MDLIAKAQYLSANYAEAASTMREIVSPQERPRLLTAGCILGSSNGVMVVARNAALTRNDCAVRAAATRPSA
jgi:hypothetical protein